MVNKAIEDSPGAADGEFPIVIAATPATARQRKIAFGAFIVLVVFVVLTVPFANIQIVRIDAFVPAIQSAMCVADLLSAAFLFAQYSIYPQRALLALASGYLFSGLFAFLQILAFPGTYAPTSQIFIGDGLNSAGWLFVCWHTAFPLFVIVYVLTKDEGRGHSRSRRPTTSIIKVTIAYVVTVTAGLTWIATEGVGYLPRLYENAIVQAPFANYVNLFLSLLSTAALILLFARRRTILDYWLLVTLLAWLPNFVVSVLFTVVRFTVGWYAARIFALIAGSSLLFVLVAETMVLYVRLVYSIRLSRREQANRLMSVDAATAAMAHEIRQPLGGIMNYGEAALLLLKRIPPGVTEAQAYVSSMIEITKVAEQTIASVRELLSGGRTDHRLMIRLDDVAQHAVALLELDLKMNRITVLTEYQDGLPEVLGDHTQLQQVILNLIKNAIDSMSTIPPESRQLRLTTSNRENSAVLLCIEDHGIGISAQDRDRIFQPFFTKKPAGTGLGLSICRTIIEDHGGNLRLAKTGPDGSIFEIALPLAGR